MPELDVVFDVPEQIALGLASGSLERVGGVIVSSATKQVVAWLRDGTINQALDTGTSVLSPQLATIISAARTGISLYNTHVTQHAVSGLSRQIQLASTLATFTASGQVVNLAVAVVSFREILQRLDRLSTEIGHLGELIGQEFARDRDTRFRVALQAARDVFEGTNLDNRDNAMRSAVDGLYEARENFLSEFQRLLKQADDYQILVAAQHMLARALYAAISRVRCYLASEEIELAKRRLSEDVPLFLDCTQTLILRMLGDRPAAYFHQAVEAPDVERFLYVQQWLRQGDPLGDSDRSALLFEIINELRVDFWNTDIIQDEYGPFVLNQIARRPVRKFADKARELTERLSYVELLIENYERLLGFELELRSFHLSSPTTSFDEWSQLVSEKDIAEHGIGIILDRDALDNLNPSM